MALINKLFGKKSSSPAKAAGKNLEEKSKNEIKNPVILPLDKKMHSNILLSSVTAEKALYLQSVNQYVFKVAPNSNKIEIAKEVSKTYNVKAVAVNIINIPRKARQVGRSKGFKAGYKKAVVTLAKGQSIEIK